MGDVQAFKDVQRVIDDGGNTVTHARMPWRQTRVPNSEFLTRVGC